MKNQDDQSSATVTLTKLDELPAKPNFAVHIDAFHVCNAQTGEAIEVSNECFDELMKAVATCSVGLLQILHENGYKVPETHIALGFLLDSLNHPPEPEETPTVQ